MAEEDGVGFPPNKSKIPLFIFFKNARLVFKMDELGLEIAQIAFPAALALTADPIASLVDTAFIGQIGPVELAAVGVSIALFNQVSRIAIFPLVSVTTSFVAEEDAVAESSSEQQELECLESNSSSNTEAKELLPQSGSEESCLKSETSSLSIETSKPQRRHIPSASSALVIGAILGLLQAIFLISLAKPLLNYMGVKSDSPMLPPAQRYLTLRSLGAPAVLLSLAMQGIFRGFKDTKTPLYATVAGDVTNMILDPIFMFVFRLGVSGAAIAHIISQYLISIILFWRLVQLVDLLPPSMKNLKFGRVIAVTFCVTLAASMAARLGPTPMAAFQVCLQVWLATSLLADGLAVAGQFVALTQPINALAFVFDGINFGASDFAYSAFSMVMVAVVSILCLIFLSSHYGFIGIWVALTIYMSLRAFAGFWRIGTGTGPWNFLRS
ncbi:Protein DETOXIFICATION 42 [Bienertia sinuspersici]